MIRLAETMSVLLLALALAGCNKFEYHPYDGRIKGNKNINRKGIAAIEKQCKGKDTVRFAVISDVQRHYDETKDLVSNINGRGEIDFTLCLGDVTDFGETKEYVWMRDILGKLRKPYVSLIGNHDCLGTGEHVFKEVYGLENFAFTAGNTRFVCLNTNSREYDYTTAVPDFSFIMNERDSFPPNAQYTVVAMHARPGSEQFDNNVKRLFEEELLKFPELLFCLNGHGHHLSLEDLFGDGVIYYGVPDASKLTYLVFTIYPDGGYEREVVSL